MNNKNDMLAFFCHDGIPRRTKPKVEGDEGWQSGHLLGQDLFGAAHLPQFRLG